MTDIIKALEGKIEKENIFVHEPMSKHTSFKTGGYTDYLVLPESKEQLKNIMDIVLKNKIPYYIMGNGTNLLVTDEGFHGVIIQIYSKMCHVLVEDEIVEAKAGALLSVIASKALENNLTGFEFASGIPGTLGGAICMNAGAYDGEMKDILICAEVMTPEGEIKTLSAQELKLSYRHSIIPENNFVVLSGKIKLKKGNEKEIKEKMLDFSNRRREKQPLTYPSAGSTFKRPEGYFAGKLISDSGLKGYRIGGAQVSEKHAGFIINENNATAKDILDLIQYCQKTVYEKFHVTLNTEVKIIGEHR